MASESGATKLRREDSASPSLSANTGVTTPSPTDQANDLLDDVFGSSEPASPAVAPTTVHVGADAGAVASNPPPEHKESADISRLRSIHSTSGYRDGLAVARETALQPGFDEGYSLGAALGLKAGLVVGSFESLWNAVQGPQNAKVKAQLETLTKRCIKDLSRSNLLSVEHLNIDGTWKWDAPVDGSLHDVAAAHPVVKAWLLKLDSVLQRLGVSSEKLEIRWTEPVASTAAAVPNVRTVTLPAARSGALQSGQTFDF